MLIEIDLIVVIFFWLTELGLKDGSQLIVADATSPSSIEFHLKLHSPMDT